MAPIPGRSILGYMVVSSNGVWLLVNGFTASAGISSSVGDERQIARIYM